MSESQLTRNLLALKESIGEIGALDDPEFDEAIALWHDVVSRLKDAVFDTTGQYSRVEFEEGWGAQSVQFVIDCLPEIHRVMLTYYRRKDDLSILDVGAGSGAGTNVLALLHSDRYIYSKLTIDAVDRTPARARWVKAMYPKVNYEVADVFDLPANRWDLVLCSHVIEHVPAPRKFIDKLVDICRGFLFVYSPYNELDRIPAHINTVTEALYEGLNVESMKVVKSMGWHPAKEDECLLAVVDCR